MAGEVFIGVDYASTTVEELRAAAEVSFFGPLAYDLEDQVGRPRREHGPKVVHGDMFDAARFIAEAGGVLSPETSDYLDINDATHMAESLGSFDTQIEVPCDEYGNILILGEFARRSRQRAVLAAKAMERADRGFAFYTRRTLQEYLNTKRDEEMMKSAPIGSARVLFSPCEPSAYGRELQMQPDRDMAIMQITWKRPDRVMVLRSVSLDRASLPTLRQLIAEHGVEVAADAKPEDYLAYVFSRHFETQQDLDDFVESIKNRFDELVMAQNPEIRDSGLKPRQGVVGYDARNVHTTVEDILNTGQGRLALRQRRKLDFELARHVKEAQPLSHTVKAFANECIRSVRSNGATLLSPTEKAKVTTLLNVERVSLDDESCAEALKIIITVHNSAIEESYRDFLAGEKGAMGWMLFRGIDISDIRHIVGTGTKAIEEGRASGACGAGVEIVGGLPDYRVNPDGYLIAIFGRNSLHRSKCDGCGRTNRLVAKCRPTYCGGCYGRRMANSKRGKLALAA